MLYGSLFSLSKAVVKLEISDQCTCTYLDENDEEVQSEYCDGWCSEWWEYELKQMGVIGKTWHVEAHDIGWRNLSGSKTFTCTSARNFVQQISGMDCSCTVQIMASRRKPATLTAYVYHHDSPTGELREIRRIK